MTDAIYTVTTLHFRENGSPKANTASSRRTVGWFPDLDTATQCIVENWGDIHETVYEYAVIERVTPGLYSTDDRDERWFQWEDGAYRPSTKPERLAGCVFFSMG